MSSIYIGNKNEEAFTELVKLVGNCGGRLNKQDLDALERRYDRAGKIGLVFKAIIEDWVPESSRGRLIGLKKKAKARQQEYQETNSGESDFHKAAYPQEDPEELLWHAVTLDQEETLRDLLRHPGVDIDAVNRSGQTALHQAISEGSLKVLRVLLESGANVHKIDLEVQTPLHQCSQNGSTEGLAWILEAGADLSAVGELGCNIWHLAAKPDNLEILKALFLLKGNPQDFLGLKCFQGLTPIFHALASSHVLHDSLLEQLLQKGVDVDARDSFGKTALMKAAEINKPEHVASLLLRMRNKFVAVGGLSLLHLAVGNFSTLEFLLGLKIVEVDCRAENNRTPLHDAAFYSDSPSTQGLILHGADINAKTDFRRTPLHFAAESGDDVFAYIIGCKADACIVDRNGNLPIHFAAFKGRNNIVSILLDAGLFDSENLDGMTPELCALEAGHTDTAKLINKAIKSRGKQRSLFPRDLVLD
ncbi:ankyrin repeat-containing domain protein [Phyllosticta citrichinensis]